MRAYRLLGMALFFSGSLFVNPAYGDDKSIVELLQQYIALDTTNPPGMEIRGADFFAAIFEQRGIAYELVESEPGRANIWAKLEGGDKLGVLLLHHMDVVPADATRWQYPPFEGRVVDARVLAEVRSIIKPPDFFTCKPSWLYRLRANLCPVTWCLWPPLMKRPEGN
ncbi:MAG: hypothetical protein KUG71_02910 [Porticoccaceae bacterium]|nr:hypothetical protein [Porticoccaceae bacterium]